VEAPKRPAAESDASTALVRQMMIDKRKAVRRLQRRALQQQQAVAAAAAAARESELKAQADSKDAATAAMAREALSVAVRHREELKVKQEVRNDRCARAALWHCALPPWRHSVCAWCRPIRNHWTNDWRPMTRRFRWRWAWQ
jgi:hypothetical protein